MPELEQLELEGEKICRIDYIEVKAVPIGNPKIFRNEQFHQKIDYREIGQNAPEGANAFVLGTWKATKDNPLAQDPDVVRFTPIQYYRILE